MKTITLVHKFLNGETAIEHLSHFDIQNNQVLDLTFVSDLKSAAHLTEVEVEAILICLSQPDTFESESVEVLVRDVSIFPLVA